MSQVKSPWWLALIAAAVVALILLLTTHFSHARDPSGRYAASPLKPWFDQLKNQRGGLCCSDADGTAIADADWRSRDGHYQVLIDDSWRDVPDHAVITEPNRAGKTMVWPQRGYFGLTIICFMPGSMS